MEQYLTESLNFMIQRERECREYLCRTNIEEQHSLPYDIKSAKNRLKTIMHKLAITYLDTTIDNALIITFSK